MIWIHYPRRRGCKCKQDSVGVRRIFWWYHGILVVHLQDSVGAFWAIKGRFTSIRGHFVENVMTDELSTVCSWWCMMLFLIIKITGIFSGKSVLKRVCNVTGMVPWRRLVACYSCFILHNVYVCLHFCSHVWWFAPHCDFPHPFVKIKSFRGHIFDSWC